jgi:hypothetical protein
MLHGLYHNNTKPVQHIFFHPDYDRRPQIEPGRGWMALNLLTPGRREVARALAGLLHPIFWMCRLPPVGNFTPP